MVNNFLQLLFHVIVFALGLSIVVWTLYSAIETLVLPRGANDWLSRVVFLTTRRIFTLFAPVSIGYERRERIMAFYAPVALLALLPTWLLLALAGYTMMFWGIGFGDWSKALEVSGSSLLTLGFVPVGRLLEYALAFSAAAIGLLFVALLIAYLPTIYAAFQRRELMVNMLEVRAGSPPTAWELIERYHRIHGLDGLHDLWRSWEQWFVDIEESHTSIAALVFFRSQQSDRSWVTAAGAVLDAAALVRSLVELERDAQADLCIRSGYLCLRRICDFFGIEYDANPRPDDPISITRQEFEAVCSEMAERGVPLKADNEQAWRDYRGWRVNYDVPLLALATMTMAPYAPWSSDRSYPRLNFTGFGWQTAAPIKKK